MLNFENNGIFLSFPVFLPSFSIYHTLTLFFFLSSGNIGTISLPYRHIFETNCSVVWKVAFEMICRLKMVPFGCWFSSVGWAGDTIPHGWKWPAQVRVWPLLHVFPYNLHCFYPVKLVKRPKNIFLKKTTQLPRCLTLHLHHEHTQGWEQKSMCWRCGCGVIILLLRGYLHGGIGSKARLWHMKN